MIFERDGVKFSYGFSYNESGIVDEYLYYWSSVKRSVVFERNSSTDYVFAEPENVCNLEIGTYDEYVGCDEKKSDHVPLIFNLKE
jgi:hypothetical protein